jgi:rsbT co-antagonist protein RsbR
VEVSESDPQLRSIVKATMFYSSYSIRRSLQAEADPACCSLRRRCQRGSYWAFMENETDSSPGEKKLLSGTPQELQGAKVQPATDRMFRALLEAAPDAIVIVNKDCEVVLVNSQTENLFGFTRKEMLGRPVEMLVPERFRNGHRGLRNSYFAEPRVRAMGAGFRLYALHKDGREIPVEISLSPLQADGALLVTSSIRDVTEHRLAEERIQKQANEILEMATVPVVQVWEGIVLVPLIGTLDSQRTQHLMERLLNRVAETTSPIALLDITGVPTVDTQTAQHLIETIAAVRLLGSEVILTGVRPTIAQTLVHLGIDLSNVLTRSSLTAGLRVALDLLNLRVAPKGGAR